MTESSDDRLLDQLMDQWEAARNEGRSISVSQLCQGHPEIMDPLKEEIAAWEWVRSRRDEFFPDLSDATQAWNDRPKSLGRYELKEIVGAGGFGIVWKGHDPDLDRIVAIKLPQFSSDKDRDICIQEARHLASLDHPGIVKIYDVGRDGDDVYLVAQFVEGNNLAERMGEGPVGIDEGTRILKALCDALQYAHDQGIVHRDIKPQNVLLGRDGRVYLADFGISIESATPVVSDLRGTFPYQAPEQMTPGDLVDYRADLFSLGVVAYELFTGKLPFRGGEQGRFNRDFPTPPNELNPDVPDNLSSAIMRSLRPVPSERVGSAREFYEQMSAGRSRLSILVGACLVTVVAATIYFWSGGRPPKQVTSMGAIPPLAQFTFNDPNDRLKNDGITGRNLKLHIRGNCQLVPADDKTHPPDRLKDVVQLQKGSNGTPSDPWENPGVVCEKHAILSGHAFTISLWFRRASSDTIDTLLHIGEANGFGLATVPQLTVWADEANQLRILSYHRFPDVEGRRPQMQEAVPIPGSVQDWHHLAITFDSGPLPVMAGDGVFRAYIDGQKVLQRDRINLGPALRNTKGGIGLGTCWRKKSEPDQLSLEGWLDEIKMWNRALSDDEILADARR